ncbi:SusD/RagB family nutrient-binding outer membrane lipoprotein [Ancylomarina euxinus]|uniref:SusD/RagB family nutrient-binding outer membrane lipoprotein n=1 Tax=Ancylomarina euxinus TaxID=2283627 RepID=A0A425XXE2_9BACT|nr:SusD/RagB family nutrient-binding outer membrane lipoprotein [Ancylomarina euxinus]MCZ4696101.1 SusD/RagB family nutrient-binding outer membrane lipoprotein [Ancylomarina euxinus]MUP16510.1 SusD/RagB family nutrient-binding outer membrane lipoprotein [Ancylomarina euxinus]RRG19340.1 SusD/RagB family nutrient-binding outer membrane lipoprotein [Ancylomarina euxinus]
MKRISIILLTLFLAYSCTDNLEDRNVDTKNAATAAGETFFTGAQKNLTDDMASINVNTNVWRQFVQQITSTTYNDEANYNIANRKVPDGLWATMYRDVLNDLAESERIIKEAPAAPVGIGGTNVQKNQLAMIEVMNVYAYAILVETFGDIPYTEALDITNVLPKYDDGQTVYADLIARLSAAIANMDVAEDSFGGADLIYGGDVALWKKFANSFKLRMGLVMYDVDATLGTATVQEAIASGVFASNLDNATFEYLDATPNTNPMWEDLVQSGRKDFIVAKPFVDVLNTLNDPRRTVYFDDNIEDGYVGAVYGLNSSYGDFSHIGGIFYEATLPHVLLDYANVEFMMAEAAELSLVGTPADAAAHYDEAITASFDYYEVADVATYLAQPSVAYATATGTWKEKIGTQKWISLYNQGFLAWTEFRRLDYPALVAPDTADDAAEGFVPRRFTYPIGEQTLNGDNYTTAAAAVGGDKLSTKLFWDKF